MTTTIRPDAFPDVAQTPISESAPPPARVTGGWIPGVDRPFAEEFNYLLGRTPKWLRYIDERMPWSWWGAAVLEHGGVAVDGPGTGVDVSTGEIVVSNRVLHVAAVNSGVLANGVWYGFYDPTGALFKSLISSDAFGPGRIPIYEATVVGGVVTRLISLLRRQEGHERLRPLTVGPAGFDAMFRTLREACLYARSHLGTKRHEILLVGDIAEPDVLDSLVLGSGTTIRAAVFDPATNRAPRVTWTHDGPLFDLAGVDGLTLENLEALKTVGAGPSDDDVLILIDGSVTGLRLIRCIVPSGGGQAMRGVLAVKTGGNLVDLEVRGGNWSPTEHVVRLENGGLAERWLLDGTSMAVLPPVPPIGAFSDGILLDPTASSDVSDVQLRGLRVYQSWGDCIKVGGRGIQVQQGHCSASSGQKGIYFLGTAIRAEAIGVHISDGVVGVRVDTGADHTRIEACHIELSTGRGIHIGADNVALVGNTVRESGLVAIDSVGTRGTIVGNVASWAAPPVNGIDLAGGNNRAVVGNSINGTAIVNAGGADVIANNT